MSGGLRVGAVALCSGVGVGVGLYLAYRSRTHHGASVTDCSSQTTATPSTAPSPEEGLLYFDFNATTPIASEVADAMLPYLREHFGNPSSNHAFGHAAKAGLDTARMQVATCLGCAPNDIVFTSGATESLNWAIKGTAHAARVQDPRRTHIITSCVEHPIIPAVCDYLKGLGFEITYLPVDEAGIVDVADLHKALTDRTCLVTIMMANNETGSVQPIRELSSVTKAFNPSIVFHTDASQAVGKLDVHMDGLPDVDLMTVAGHKIYAPKGVGCLYLRSGSKMAEMRLRPENLFHGPGQERGFRAGTENVLLAVGLGRACQRITRDGEGTRARFCKLRDQLSSDIQSALLQLAADEAKEQVPVRINGPRDVTKRLPNTLSIAFKGVRSDAVLRELSGRVACSAAAACHSGGTVSVSRVLRCMHVPAVFARGTLRLSVGESTTEEQVHRCASIVARAVWKVRWLEAQ